MTEYSITTSTRKGKKYDVYHKGNYLLSFGGDPKKYQHFYDLLGHYSDLDHLDLKRWANYHKRHGKSNDPNSAKFWSSKILWPDINVVANNIKSKYPNQKRYFKDLDDEQVIKHYESFIKNKERPIFDNIKTKKSTWATKIKKIYPDIKNYNDLDELAKVSGIKKKYLQKVIDKGYSAYYNSGSRPNVTGHAWAWGRLYRFLVEMNKNRGKDLDFDTEIRDQILGK